ncbi:MULTISPECIES: SDR family NAD(P)-dependent oxidoreductase [Thermomonosporaceae]|uniref:SDR family NAD(P)-dependent oxidoreductase n=1 Tax=Thermomonosporaceae TaxID=2012 RepID=UPI00255AA282|nr:MULTISPECIES: SDR family NAD(P)-dependent oxidoreductase [Thermomonosporaceae]MDL4775823.1 SDR family NAD(P)-dependent oxidoreductase [Actinomadura xylanilytica]
MSDNKVALVTGTSSGIGLHTAVGLARTGARVVATMRDTGRADPLLAEAADQGVDLTVRRLDVTDHDGARACLDEVAAEFGPVEILVNNAGQSVAGTLEQLDDAVLRRQLDVNLLGAAALTRHVLPSMRESGAGRIVSVTSDSAVVGQPFLDAYCASKFALEGLMQSLAPVAARFGVVVSVVEPAHVSTNMAENVDLQALSDPDDPYRGLTEKFLRSSYAAMARAQAVQDAAAVVIEAATTGTPRFRWQTSEAAVASARLSLADLDGGAVLKAMSGWLD